MMQRWRRWWKQRRDLRTRDKTLGFPLRWHVPVARLTGPGYVWPTRTTYYLAWLSYLLPLWGKVSLEVVLITAAVLLARCAPEVSVACQATASLWVVLLVLASQSAEHLATMLREGRTLTAYVIGPAKKIPPHLITDL